MPRRLAPLFGRKGDVKLAHRRCKIRRCDHGYQACQLDQDTVWIDEVLTFGVGTAAYYIVVEADGGCGQGRPLLAGKRLVLATGLRGRRALVGIGPEYDFQSPFDRALPGGRRSSFLVEEVQRGFLHGLGRLLGRLHEIGNGSQ